MPFTIPPWQQQRLLALAYDPSVEDIARLRDNLARVREAMTAAALRGVNIRPTVVITPLGLAHRSAFERRLAELAIDVLARRSVAGWSRLSTLLQVTWDDEPGLQKAVAFEALWRELYPSDTCECWELASVDHFERFHAAKPELREGFGAEYVRIATPRFCFRAKLHPFHSPEPKRVAAESAWLDAVIPERASTHP